MTSVPAYEPTVFHKTGEPDEIAYTWRDHWNLIFEGYRPGDPVPDQDHSFESVKFGDLSPMNADVRSAILSIGDDIVTPGAVAATLSDPAVQVPLTNQYGALWKPSTSYAEGDTAIVQGFVAKRRTAGVSGATSDAANWLIGTEPGNVPIVKPLGDGRAGVWEMTHNDTTGYLYHLLAGASMGHSQALIAHGIDNDGIGGLYANKSKGRAIVIDQRASITEATAYGIHATQRSSLATLVRLETQSADAAPLLELVTGVDVDGPTRLLMLVSDRAGEAGRISAVDGKLRWSRDVRVLNKASGEVATYLENSTSTAANSANTRKALRGASQDYFFGATGSAGVYYPYVIDHGGSQLHFRVAPNVSAADPLNPQPSEIGTLTTVLGIRYASGAPQLGFFATTPVARKSGWGLATGTAKRSTFDTASVTLADLAGVVKALIDDLHSTAGYGLLTA